MQVKIGLIQMDVHIKDVDYNFQQAQTLLEKAMEHKPDILVLPETWNTGFITGDALQDLADINGQRTQTFLSHFAKAHSVNIVGGSIAENQQGTIYNRSYIYDRQGHSLGHYDKMHGFSPAKEHLYYQGGEGTIYFELDGLRCSMVTCYDIRFPELVRMSALQGIDILFVVSQWPTMRLKHWQILNTARAIENQIYLCAVNGCGHIGRISCAGHSLTLDPWGETLVEMDDQEGIAFATIDTAILDDIRQKINIYQDRKPDYYQLNQK